MNSRATSGRTLAAAAVLLAVVGCTGSQATDGALAAYPGAEEQIRERYDAGAMEGGGRCEEVVLASILDASVSREDETSITFDVNYRFLPSAELNAVTKECSGFASRSFTFDKVDGGLVLMRMGGEQDG